MDWQRATNDKQKESRKNEIYNATLTLYKKHGYENVSFNAIAKEANFTKSNMYRYFESKEDIFLNIFGDLFKIWQMHYVTELKKLNDNVSFVEFAQTWVNSFLKFPDFLDLTPLLFLTLEKNSSYNQLLKFKAMSRDLLIQISIEIGRIYPSLDQYRAFQLLNSSFATTSSFWASNFQNEFIKKIYEQDDFKFMKPNFKEELTASIEIFLKGLLINEKNI
jgi:AcrR family transcriptional regulator